MTDLTQEGNNNIRSTKLTATDGTLIQTNPDPESTEYQSVASESFVSQDEIQMTLEEFNDKIKDNDISIKRLEKSMAALYDKLDKTPLTQEPKVSSKKSKKKKGKKGKKIDKKGKKGKGKKIKRNKKTNSAKASINTERRKTLRTNSKGKKGQTKIAGKK
jgi:uncharacterized coiled-coil protein SlyX